MLVCWRRDRASATIRTVHRVIARLELRNRSGRSIEVTVARALVGAFVVDSLRGCEDDLLHRQSLVLNRLQHQRGADAIYRQKLCDFWHIAAEGRLVKDDRDPVQRPFPIPAIADISLDELDIG